MMIIALLTLTKLPSGGNYPFGLTVLQDTTSKVEFNEFTQPSRIFYSPGTKLFLGIVENTFGQFTDVTLELQEGKQICFTKLWKRTI